MNSIVYRYRNRDRTIGRENASHHQCIIKLKKFRINYVCPLLNMDGKLIRNEIIRFVVRSVLIHFFQTLNQIFAWSINLQPLFIGFSSYRTDIQQPVLVKASSCCGFRLRGIAAANQPPKLWISESWIKRQKLKRTSPVLNEKQNHSLFQQMAILGFSVGE